MISTLSFSVLVGQAEIMQKLASEFNKWTDIYYGLSLRVAVALVIPVSSVNCEGDFSAMNRVRDFQPCKRALCTFSVHFLFCCLLLSFSGYACLFLFQVNTDLRNKLKGEYLAECLIISVSGPAPEAQAFLPKQRKYHVPKENANCANMHMTKG